MTFGDLDAKVTLQLKRLLHSRFSIKLSIKRLYMVFVECIYQSHGTSLIKPVVGLKHVLRNDGNCISICWTMVSTSFSTDWESSDEDISTWYLLFLIALDICNNKIHTSSSSRTDYRALLFIDFQNPDAWRTAFRLTIYPVAPIDSRTSQSVLPHAPKNRGECIGNDCSPNQSYLHYVWYLWYRNALARVFRADRN